MRKECVRVPTLDSVRWNATKEYGTDIKWLCHINEARVHVSPIKELISRKISVGKYGTSWSFSFCVIPVQECLNSDAIMQRKELFDNIDMRDGSLRKKATFGSEINIIVSLISSISSDTCSWNALSAINSRANY